MPGSGKEEFVQIAQENGFSIVRMGDVVRSYVKERNLELSNGNIGSCANEQRKKHGMGIWAERTVPLLSSDLVLIDGIRGDAELEVFEKALKGDLIVVGIQASEKVRFERIKSRARSDATITWEEFSERDSRELAWGLENAMASCEYIIVNEGTLDEYWEKIREVLEAILQS
jgi:dephospho-CoA kinase